MFGQPTSHLLSHVAQAADRPVPPQLFPDGAHASAEMLVRHFGRSVSPVCMRVIFRQYVYGQKAEVFTDEKPCALAAVPAVSGAATSGTSAL